MVTTLLFQSALDHSRLLPFALVAADSTLRLVDADQRMQ